MYITNQTDQKIDDNRPFALHSRMVQKTVQLYNCTMGLGPAEGLLSASKCCCVQ